MDWSGFKSFSAADLFLFPPCLRNFCRCNEDEESENEDEDAEQNEYSVERCRSRRIAIHVQTDKAEPHRGTEAGKISQARILNRYHLSDYTHFFSVYL